MLDLPARCQLIECATSVPVIATFVPLTRELAKVKVTPIWWSGLGVSAKDRELEPDHHWNWTKIVGQHRQRGYTECWAVQTQDGHVQAAVVYRIDATSAFGVAGGRPPPAVYCEYLATAPRNRSRLVANPKYQRAGKGALLRAVAHSYALGFGGRVNLASLPHPHTEAWYRNLGFEQTGTEVDDMMVYEVRPERAQQELSRVGWL